MKNKGILSAVNNVSALKMSLTLLLTICLILANILVVKPIDLFGLPYLANTCAIITFPVTYILSDVFSEVYGYKWSRLTATWAFIGTAICSAMFALMIAIPGNSSWESQDALKAILGNTPQIAIASIVAYWFGDFANDKVFEILRKHDKKQNKFALRAILSSLVGKYVDGAIFTFAGLSFLPLNTKLTMVASCPFVQVCLEVALLPVTMLIVRVLKKVEPEESNVD